MAPWMASSARVFRCLRAPTMPGWASACQPARGAAILSSTWPIQILICGKLPWARHGPGNGKKKHNLIRIQPHVHHFFNGNKSLCQWLTELRTTMAGVALWLQRSRETSMPEFPQPTTRTRFPRKVSPLLYSQACMTLPPNAPNPSMSGTTRSAFSPVATTSHLQMYSTSEWAPAAALVETVLTRHSPQVSSYLADCTHSLNRGLTSKRLAYDSRYSMNCFLVGYSGKASGNGILGSWQNCLGRWSLSLS